MGDVSRERLGQVSRSACQVENDVVRPGSERRDERGGDRRVDGRDQLPLGLPSLCGDVPAPPRLCVRLYAATPENWGRMSRP